MKISLQWLNEILSNKLNSDDVIGVLRTIGFDVEQYEDKSKQFEGVVVGEIINIAKHPNADKLTVCTVNQGSQDLSIVCGAKNVDKGLKVPVANVGTILPNGMEIKKAKIRGIESSGMICSEKELGLSGEAAGIMHLPESFKKGDKFSSAMGLDDTMIEFEVTPNRPDALSHVGIAREISAAMKIPMILSKIRTPFIANSECSLQIDNPDDCPRYCAQVIIDIKVGPSPKFIASRLETCGIRPINNIVDITNYVQLETGQPLHAFDLDLLAGNKVHVRRGKNEALLALDGKKYNLTEEMLVIADSEQPVAIAGIMGGEDTAVSEKTKNILLEAAFFKPQLVRKTSNKLGLKSESSYRFERCIDIEGAANAQLRAVELILMCAGGERTGSKELYLKKYTPVTIQLRPERVNSVLGTSISTQVMTDILNRLNMELQNKKIGNSLLFKVPSFRVDIKEEIDMIEEIARHNGYHSVPTSRYQGMIMNDTLPETWNFHEKIRSILNGAGMFEAYNYGFMQKKTPDDMMIPSGDIRHKYISITNPLSSEFDALRTILLPGLLTNISFNHSRRNPYTRLYEIGSVFFKEDETPEEHANVACVLSGTYPKNIWTVDDMPVDFPEIKGIIELLFNRLQIADWKIIPEEVPFLHPGQSGVIIIDGKKAGEAGRLHPKISSKYELPKNVYVFELNSSILSDAIKNSIKHKEITKYPSVTRDFSFNFDNKIKWNEINSVVNAAGGALIEKIYPFDKYSGKKIGPKKYGLSFSLILRSPEKTLTDSDADSIQNKVIQALSGKLGAELRT